MKPSRRQFLSSSIGTLGFPLVSTIQGQTTTGNSDWLTPSSPEQGPTAPVISEAYGELNLSSTNPYWAWEFPLFSEPVVIEYEIESEDFVSEPDVLVFDRRGFEKYKIQVGTHPILQTETRDIRWLGTLSIPTGLSLGNLSKQFKQNTDWTIEEIVHTAALECLTESQATRGSHRIESGKYYIVIDWTEKVLAEPDNEEMTADVSIRARHKREQEAINEAISVISGFFDSVQTANVPLEDVIVSVAEGICNQVPSELTGFSIDDVSENTLEVERAVSILRSVFDIVDEKIGYSPPFVDEVLKETATWVHWGSQIIPVISTLQTLIEDACAVANSEPKTVTSDVENLLMSFGVLVIEFVMIKYSLVSRAASVAVRQAHTYLLGILREVLGLKVYLALLRELYILLQFETSEILEKIERITRDVVDTNEFLSTNENVNDVAVIENMEENDLESLDLDSSFNFGPLDLSPECRPD